MECSLVELFLSLTVPENPEEALCDDCENRDYTTVNFPVDYAIISGMYSSAGVDLSLLPGPARRLYELSVNAFDALVHGWMSGLPIKANLVRFGRKLLDTASRAEADRAATDRGDTDVKLILDISYKVWHEVDRMRGLLRFSPNNEGLYTAYCTPDYFILPALAEHFTLRFADTPWEIIDEKRGCCLCRLNSEAPPVLGAVKSQFISNLKNDFRDSNLLFQDCTVKQASDEWEQLWRHYHKTINNESRNNPDLQRSFMPKRYWGNLPEKKFT